MQGAATKFSAKEWDAVLADASLSVNHTQLRAMALEFLSLHGYANELEEFGEEPAVPFLAERGEVRRLVATGQFAEALAQVALIAPRVPGRGLALHLLGAQAVQMARDGRVDDAMQLVSTDVAQAAGQLVPRPHTQHAHTSQLERYVEAVLFPAGALAEEIVGAEAREELADRANREVLAALGESTASQVDTLFSVLAFAEQELSTTTDFPRLLNDGAPNTAVLGTALLE